MRLWGRSGNLGQGLGLTWAGLQRAPSVLQDCLHLVLYLRSSAFRLVPGWAGLGLIWLGSLRCSSELESGLAHGAWVPDLVLGVCRA